LIYVEHSVYLSHARAPTRKAQLAARFNDLVSPLLCSKPKPDLAKRLSFENWVTHLVRAKASTVQKAVSPGNTLCAVQVGKMA
jgi:hypothetical protein